MKKLFLIILIAFAVARSNVMAQRVLVYTVNGDVTVKTDNKFTKVAPKQFLTMDSFLRIAKDSKVVLVDEKSSSMYTLSTPAEGLIRDISKKGNSTVKKLSSQYLAFLLKKNTEESGKRNTHMQSTAASFRDSDSLLVAEPNDSTMVEPNDSTRGKSKKESK